MKTNGYIIAGLIAFIVFVIFQNTYEVQLNFLFWDYKILLSGLIIISFALGMLISWLYKKPTKKNPN